MIDKIKEIQEEMNASPCVFCGKTHNVRLDGSGSFVKYHFSEDSCDKFIDRVKKVVSIVRAGADFPLP